MNLLARLLEACGWSSFAIVEEIEIAEFSKRCQPRNKKGRFKKVRKCKAKLDKIAQE